MDKELKTNASQTNRLKQLADIRAGHPFRGAIKESDAGNGFVIQTRDQDDNGRIHWPLLARTQISGRGEPEWLTAGDIIFSARGLRNLASVIPHLDNPTVCSPHYFVITNRRRDIISDEFLAWQLNQKIAQRYFSQSAEGSAQRSIRRVILEETPINVPSLDDQQRIVTLAHKMQREQQIYQQLIKLRQIELETLSQHFLISS